jgi:hypothetical protein
MADAHYILFPFSFEQFGISGFLSIISEKKNGMYLVSYSFVFVHPWEGKKGRILATIVVYNH